MRRIHAALLASLLVLAVVPALQAYERSDGGTYYASSWVERIGAADDDPTAFAVEVSQRMYDTGAAPIVLLSRDDEWPDALAASSLLGFGPLLLTPTEDLAPGTADEIGRALSPDGLVLILGGPTAVSEDVEADLRLMLGVETRRLAGDDRYATAIAVADELLAMRARLSEERRLTVGGPSVDTSHLPDWSDGGPPVSIARGNGPGTSGWADSVAVGAVSAWDLRVVLLTGTETLHSGTAAWLAERAGTDVAVLGGESAVSSAVLDELRTGKRFSDLDVRRVTGDTRNETAVAIARELGSYPIVDPHFQDHAGVTFVDGWAEDGWAYGLAAAGYHATPYWFFDRPQYVLFTHGDEVPEIVKDLITTCSSEAATVSLAGPAEPDLLAAQLFGHTPPGCTDDAAYTFLSRATGDEPTSYPTCDPLRIVANFDGAPAGAADRLAVVLSELEAASDFTFDFLGETTETVSDGGTEGVRSGAEDHGAGMVPILVAWPQDWSISGALGTGGSTPTGTFGARESWVTGVVAMRRGAIADDQQPLLHDTLLHELLHVLGLGHTTDAVNSVMHARTTGDGGLQPSDVNGLRLLDDWAGDCG